MKKRNSPNKMSKEQLDEAKSLAGKMMKKDIAKKFGVGLSYLKKKCQDVSWKIEHDQHFLEGLFQFAEIHGQKKALKEFNCKKYIFEKYRNIRGIKKPFKWDDAKIAAAVKMRGIISYNEQSKILGASEATIEYLWAEKFKIRTKQINGMYFNKAKHLLVGNVPCVHINNTYIVLWEDFEKHLNQDVPFFIKDAISTLAKFQRWLSQKKET